MIPYLREPTSGLERANDTIPREEAFVHGWGRDEFSPGFSCDLDALRFQEILSSLGRVLRNRGFAAGGSPRNGDEASTSAEGDTAGGGVSGAVPAGGGQGASGGVPNQDGAHPGNRSGGATMRRRASPPSSTISVLLSVLLVLCPEDVIGEHEEEDWS